MSSVEVCAGIMVRTHTFSNDETLSEIAYAKNESNNSSDASA